MKSIKELIDAVEKHIPLFWNDPDPIPGNDYKITYVNIEALSDIEKEDEHYVPILILYGNGSEAQVQLHEIIIDPLYDY